ncbi:hypothetical protein [Priestia aryabhattai]
MLKELKGKKEEMEVCFQRLNRLSLYQVKHKEIRPYWITLNFRYETKRGRYALFSFSISATQSNTLVFQSLSVNDPGTTIEVRTIFSEAVDIFLEEIMSLYAPSMYISIIQKPIKYPPSYIAKEERKCVN